MTKAKDLRDQSQEDLESALDDARKALFKLRSEVTKGGEIEKPHRISITRREIARIMTLLHEKQTVTAVN